MNRADFSQEVEEFVAATGSSYMDAILHIIDRKGLEIETSAKMLNKVIKEKLEAEAAEANLLKEKICKLPI